jgi:hypothetical protein
MKRRDLLASGLAAAGFAALVPAIANAQDAAPKLELVVTTAIGTNHGHVLELSAADAVRLLRATQAGPLSLDIRGQSTHGHALVFAHQTLLQLFVHGQVEMVATGSHDHDVTIKLDVV